jgi:hypothetical protein
MHKKLRITMLIAAIATGISGISLAQTPAPAPRRAAAIRDHQG